MENTRISLKRQSEKIPRPLRNKTCVVTGSSRGIGRSIAMRLADYGANIVVHYNSSASQAEDVANKIESAGGTVEITQANVADFDSVKKMAVSIHNSLGSVDVLVNNAGVTVDKQFGRLTPEDWDRVIDVNLSGAFNCTKVFFDDLKTATEGRIINISSIVGQQGNLGQVTYAASKSGLFGFTKSLALELANHGTTVNCVAPGFTSTEMVESIPNKIQERIRDRIPLNRFAACSEIAPVVQFLASSGSSYVTGEIINVNGGMYA